MSASYINARAYMKVLILRASEKHFIVIWCINLDSILLWMHWRLIEGIFLDFCVKFFGFYEINKSLIKICNRRFQFDESKICHMASFYLFHNNQQQQYRQPWTSKKIFKLNFLPDGNPHRWRIFIIVAHLWKDFVLFFSFLLLLAAVFTSLFVTSTFGLADRRRLMTVSSFKKSCKEKMKTKFKYLMNFSGGWEGNGHKKANIEIFLFQLIVAAGILQPVAAHR
jgi:hypothetical protein